MEKGIQIKIDNYTDFDKQHLGLLESGCISLERYMFCRETFTNLEIAVEKQKRLRNQQVLPIDKSKGLLRQILDFLAGRQ